MQLMNVSGLTCVIDSDLYCSLLFVSIDCIQWEVFNRVNVPANTTENSKGHARKQIGKGSLTKSIVAIVWFIVESVYILSCKIIHYR